MNINLNSVPFTTPCENGSGLQCKHNLIALQVVKILVTPQNIIRTLNRFHYSFTSIVIDVHDSDLHGRNTTEQIEVKVFFFKE